MRFLLIWLGFAVPIVAAEPWWIADPLRILDLTTSITRVDYRDPVALAKQKAALGYNAEHLDAMGMPAGLDDKHFYFRSSVAPANMPDYLKRYVPEAKKNGIRTLIYFNVHWYTKAFAEEHPDWRQIREDGKPVDGVYETGTDMCVNTPWRKWCFQIVKDLADYGVDGIFYDGPIYRAESCYCKYCQTKFQAKYGRPLPSKAARQGKDFRDLIQFQADSLADFLRDTQAVLKKANPNAALYMNGGVRGGNWATARLNRVLVKEQDILGSEGGFISGDLTRTPLWKPGLTARMLETQAGGKPTVIFSAAGHKPWTFSLLPAPELRLLYADTIANAASVWMGITPFEFDQPEMSTLTEMNRFVEKNAAYYRKTKSEARVAIVWSDTTANFYAGADAQMIDINKIPNRSAVGNLDAEFNGMADALVRSQVPFDVLDDTSLESESLARYQAIFLPNVACMNDKTAARLREYVQQGGNLVATFETSHYDDTGVHRQDFALADVFGVRSANKIIGPTQWDFMKPVAKDPLTNGIGRELVPTSHYRVIAKASTAKPLWMYTVPLKGRYDGVPPVSEDPALLVNRVGKGTAVYISGDFGATIAQFHTPELMSLIYNAARQYSTPPVSLANAPTSVELTWRSQENGRRRMLHVVNFTGEMTRPIGAIVPLRDLKVRFNAGVNPKTVRTLMRPAQLAVRRTPEGAAEVIVPRVDEYEVLVIE